MASAVFRSIKPVAGEYAPYYDRYISLIPEGDIVARLAGQRAETIALLSGLTDAQAMFSYAPGKWNVKEVLGHLIDSERVFSYRALWFARNGQTALPSMEQDDFVKFGGHAGRALDDLLSEFEHVRLSTEDLFRSLDEAAWSRHGTASDNTVSVRALAWIIAGHERHHAGILRARYLKEK